MASRISNRQRRTRQVTAACVFTLGLLLLLFPTTSLAGGFANGKFRESTCDIVWYMQGSLGGLLMATGVLMGIAGAAVGNLKIFLASISAGIGSYAMYDLVKMQFADMGCSADGQGRTRRSAEVLQVPDIEVPDGTSFGGFAAERTVAAPIAKDDTAATSSQSRKIEIDAEDETATGSWSTLSAGE